MARVTTVSFAEKKRSGEKIAMLTAYDYPSAKLMDECGVDAVLVGDSCAMTVMGRADTLSVTMDEMVYHTRMVAGAVSQAMVVADMPFLSYQISAGEAVRNAGRLVAEGGAHAVKLEGPMRHVGAAAERIIAAGIPVMGHLGLTPQSIHQLGGYKVQARTEETQRQLIQDAGDLEKAGCFALVLEVIPAGFARSVSESLTIPTIGIGAGPDCDGQVLVMHDMLGFGLYARHVKVFADIRSQMGEAFKQYVNEVRNGQFPGKENVFS